MHKNNHLFLSTSSGSRNFDILNCKLDQTCLEYIVALKIFGIVVNTTCAAFAQLSYFPHSKSLFIIENGPFQDLKPYTNYSSAYSSQSQISLFWPIHKLPAPLTIQTRIRQLVWEPDISRHSLLREFILMFGIDQKAPTQAA